MAAEYGGASGRCECTNTGDIRTASVAKALSHPVRLAILRTIARVAKCNCAQICDELPLAQSTVSQHLKVLREAGLINLVPDGTSSRYAIRSEKIGQFSDDVGALAEGLCGPDSNCCR